MASIYNTNPWADAKLYKKHDVVQYSGKYWYALQGHTSALANDRPETGTNHESYWGGFIYVSKAGENKPHFHWNPDYNISVQSAPKIAKINFGDGYSQRVTEGINTHLLKLNLSFTKRSEKEAIAILHFLTARDGKEAFYLRVPEPYNITKKFVCPTWTSVLNFHDNFNVTAQLEEVS